MNKCLICDSAAAPFMSFGQMPVANGFLSPSQFENEYFFELSVVFCPNCRMVQLAKQPDRERMFNENYAFFSSTSTRMAEHFRAFAEMVVTKYLGQSDPFVVELGSNDGIMLQNFRNLGIRHLGIEPSANVAQVAIDKGIRAICRFFDEELASEIVAVDGQADAILGANVMCHIPYLHSVVAGMKTLLKPEGVIIFEDPYLGDIVEKISYDQIYDEHAFYFSLASVSYLFNLHGLEVIDVEPQHVHGGSMRYTISHTGAREVSSAVIELQGREEAQGLHRLETFERLRQNIERSRDELRSLLTNLRQEGKRIVGYGATSKSTTVTNYCGITPDLVSFISDTTPIKQNKFSPGVHIPVRAYQEFADQYPDYALLFAWNHADEIMAKEQKFQAAGGQWIVYVPNVEVRG
ncbi:MAG TPA: class I SAM-dependent methyltransferase [Pyrinomonadaceae bacterium]|nr:class I SAM-dependent methyltransferase [Pyrinomonadaceae bacterium]